MITHYTFRVLKDHQLKFMMPKASEDVIMPVPAAWKKQIDLLRLNNIYVAEVGVIHNTPLFGGTLSQVVLDFRQNAQLARRFIKLHYRIIGLTEPVSLADVIIAQKNAHAFAGLITRTKGNIFNVLTQLHNNRDVSKLEWAAFINLSHQPVPSAPRWAQI